MAFFVACAIFKLGNLVMNRLLKTTWVLDTKSSELVCTISSDAHTGVKALLVEHGKTTYNNRVIADALNLGPEHNFGLC